MPVTINGNGSITGLSVGGLPDGTVDADTLASNAVTTNKIANSAVTSPKTSGVGGVTMYDEWRRTSDGSGTGDITSSWARNNTNFAQIGSGMTESSGIFTFPSTGIYRVTYHIMGWRNGDTAFFGCNLNLSTDSGSSYSLVTYSRNTNSNDGNAYATAHGWGTIDVTNASTFRVKFTIDTSGTWNWRGSSGYNESFVSFMKVGET
tara:strand:- start:47 stop:661 length:615 start_codon:yes stop_codon:yes gene_type:complete